MSNEIKVGDKVRVSKDAPKLYVNGWLHDWCNTYSVVKEIDKEDAVIAPIIRANSGLAIPTKYLIKVDAEAKEATAPTIKVGDRIEELITRKSGIVLGIDGDIVVVGIPYDKEKHRWHIDSVELVESTEQTEAEKKPNVGSIKIPVEVDLTDSYWDAYAADLAKEVALKITNKHMDGKPEGIGAYVVSVAKAVVEGLKRK